MLRIYSSLIMRLFITIVFLLTFSIGEAESVLGTAAPLGTSTTLGQPGKSTTIANVSIAASSLVLVAGSGKVGTLTIQNNSAIITAKSIHVVLPTTWDVTQDASNCVSVAPGQTCILQFTPGTTPHSAQSMAVLGTNTTSTSVTMSVIQVLSITVTPANAQMFIGDTLQYTARGTYNGFASQDITTVVTWSSATGAASVSNTPGSQGLVTGLEAGFTDITATLGAIAGSTPLQVVPHPLKSIVVLPVNSANADATKQQFRAIGTYLDSTTKDITSSVLWSSSTEDAFISNTPGSQGMAIRSGLVGGRSVITATLDGVSGSATLTR
jgi:hypothetical protein